MLVDHPQELVLAWDSGVRQHVGAIGCRPPAGHQPMGYALGKYLLEDLSTLLQPNSATEDDKGGVILRSGR